MSAERVAELEQQLATARAALKKAIAAPPSASRFVGACEFIDKRRTAIDVFGSEVGWSAVVGGMGEESEAAIDVTATTLDALVIALAERLGWKG